MIALLLALLASQGTPTPPLAWTREDVESRFGDPTTTGPLLEPWGKGSVLATYVHPPEDLDGICRVHLGTAKGLRWVGLVYYSPGGHLVAAHCLRLDDLDNGHDVTPDVVKRLRKATL